MSNKIEKPHAASYSEKSACQRAETTDWYKFTVAWATKLRGSMRHPIRRKVRLNTNILLRETETLYKSSLKCVFPLYICREFENSIINKTNAMRAVVLVIFLLLVGSTDAYYCTCYCQSVTYTSTYISSCSSSGCIAACIADSSATYCTTNSNTNYE